MTKDNKSEEKTKEFVIASIPKPQGYTRCTATKVSDSHWRVSIWGKTNPLQPKSIENQDRLIDSKFIRIDVDSDGTLLYNDVSDGKLL